MISSTRRCSRRSARRRGPQRGKRSGVTRCRRRDHPSADRAAARRPRSGAAQGRRPFSSPRRRGAEALVAAASPGSRSGISAVIAAAAYAASGSTSRAGLERAFVTGHPGCDPAKSPSRRHARRVHVRLDHRGHRRAARARPSTATPVALICSGTTARQVVYRGALGELARLDSLDLPTPVIAIVARWPRLAAKLAVRTAAAPAARRARREPARTAS